MEVVLDEPADPWVKLILGPQHFQAMGRVHGGVLASRIDSAIAVVVHARLPAGAAAATIDLHVEYLWPVSRPQTLTARAKILAKGRAVATVEATVCDETGKVVAHGSAVYRLYPPPGGTSA